MLASVGIDNLQYEDDYMLIVPYLHVIILFSRRDSDGVIIDGILMCI